MVGVFVRIGPADPRDEWAAGGGRIGVDPWDCGAEGGQSAHFAFGEFNFGDAFDHGDDLVVKLERAEGDDFFFKVFAAVGAVAVGAFGVEKGEGAVAWVSEGEWRDAWFIR